MAKRKELTPEEMQAYIVLASAAQISIDALNELEGFFNKFREFPEMRGAAKTFVGCAKKVEKTIYHAMHTSMPGETLTPKKSEAMEKAYHAYSNTMEALIRKVATTPPGTLKEIQGQLSSQKEAAEVTEAVLSELKDNLAYFESKHETGRAFRLRALLNRINNISDGK
jgi:hypothetical protein